MVDYRLKIFFTKKYFIVLAMLGIVLVLSSKSANAQQSDELLEPLRLSTQQAQAIGLKRQVFDFKSSKLNFETFVPDNAQLELNTYDDKPIEKGQIGRVFPLGKIKMSYDNVVIEDTIYSYKLRFAPAAMRICQWQMNQFGYFIVHSSSKDKLAEVQLFGMQSDATNTMPAKAQFGYCYARGDVLVAHFFSSSFIENEKITNKNKEQQNSKQEEQKTVKTLRKVVSYFASNMIMANGQNNFIDDTMMKHFAIDLEGQTLVLTYPAGIDNVVNNSTRKILPYELHFVQKLETNEIFSHLFLWINKTSEVASEESFRRQADIFSQINLSSQLTSNQDANKDTDNKNNNVANKKNAKIAKSTDLSKNIKYEFMKRYSIAGFAKAGIMARAYQYKIIDKNNPNSHKLFFVSVIGYKDKTYILSYQTDRDSITQPSEFFSGLAGDIAYDSLRQSIYDYLVTFK